MAIKFSNTKEGSLFAKVLVYGESGIGKTFLASTAPRPLIISSEKKLISLKDFNLPVMLVENHIDLQEALDFVKTDPKAQDFETIILDSISDIAEDVLAYFKKNPQDGNTHPQAAYGCLADTLLPLIKQFRDIENKHVYVIAKAKRMEDQYSGISTWMPAMPGQQLGPGLPYMFDYVFPMKKGETEDGKKYRYLQTESDMQWLAKGVDSLSAIEEPNLAKIFNKVTGS